MMRRQPARRPGRLSRRRLLQLLGVGAALPALASCERKARRINLNAGKGRVVVVGAGYGGAVCARYMKYANPALHITIVERREQFISCPFSNYVLGGFAQFDDIVWELDGLRRDDIKVVQDRAVGFDPLNRTLSLQSGEQLPWERLVLSPGVDLLWDAIEGYDEAAASRMPHAWKAGQQTLLLKRQLDAMEDGGVIVIAAPELPYRCPPAPYERASVIAWMLKNKKPRSKIIILDAKDSFTKQALFEEAWRNLYPGMIEWVPRSAGGQVVKVNPDSMTLLTENAGAFEADVANVIPPQSAAAIAIEGGLAPLDNWCLVDSFTFESENTPLVHVIGDSIFPGAMPKSGFAANSQAKACAMAVVALLDEREPDEPAFMNVCYSLAAPDYGFSVAGAYRAASSGAIVAVSNAGGLSPLGAPPEHRRAEARYAHDWYGAVMSEMFG